MDEVTTRLWHGVKKGDATEVSAALEQGASADSRDNLLRTPLMEAARRGHRPIISLLLTHKADINAQDKKGDTPLLHALLPDHMEVVNLPLNAGASAGIAEKSGETAAKEITQKQIILILSTVFSIFLFVKGLQRPTKDKDLQKIEIVEMAAKLYGVFVIYQKYGHMKQLLHDAEGSSRRDH